MSAKLQFFRAFLAMAWLILVHPTSIFMLTEARPAISQLNGKHLRVIWPNWVGNPPGLAGPLKGQVMLDYLMARFNFTYHFVRVTENWLEPTRNGSKGQLSYLMNDEADLLIGGAAVPSSDLIKMVDMTSAFHYDAMSILIPVSDEISTNASAVIKPFQWPVWLSLILSTAIVTFIFKNVQSVILRDLTNQTPSRTTEQQVKQTKLTNPYLYICGNILSQGGTFTRNRLPIRLVAGVWSLAAFVFVQAYTTTLITYILSSNSKPLVNSFQDVASGANVNIFMRKFSFIENMILSSNSSEFLRKIAAKRDKSGCVLASDCLRQVKTGSNNIIMDTKVYLIDHIVNRFKQTQKCDIETVDYGLFTVIVCLTLQKNSLYTSSISKGILELRENGVINFWDTWFRPVPPRCSANVKGLAEKEANKHQQLRRLSLKNLTGAFIVLSIGFALSFIAFLYESFCGRK